MSDALLFSTTPMADVLAAQRARMSGHLLRLPCSSLAEVTDEHLVSTLVGLGTLAPLERFGQPRGMWLRSVTVRSGVVELRCEAGVNGAQDLLGVSLEGETQPPRGTVTDVSEGRYMISRTVEGLSPEEVDRVEEAWHDSLDVWIAAVNAAVASHNEEVVALAATLVRRRRVDAELEKRLTQRLPL